MSLDLRLVGAEVLAPDGMGDAPLRLGDGLVQQDSPGREVDLSGYMILPGIVDVHGDAFEKHLAPRRGAMKDIDQGLIAAEAEIASNGITTATLAQFYSWEGGMRGAEFAARVFEGLRTIRPRVGTDLRPQLRFEISMVKDYDTVVDWIQRHDIPYLVFNDHLPHEILAKGKTPPGHVGKSLRIGKNPDRHLEDIMALHAGMDRVPAALDALCARLAEMPVRLGSHDDATAEAREVWHARGAQIAEFPETQVAAETAQTQGDPVILGAPNVVRGGSHKGNASALELIMLGLCDALASDYHYPSLKRAAFLVADGGVMELGAAWGLISTGPARVLGLDDRGDLRPGKRADLVVLNPESRDVCATLSAGRVTYMKGDVAGRFVG
ncbi:alpha-D-ribose 1-methylphosphonate 5-triphosphate diphosphatase [Roseovarius sp. W115]|uniref:Alpha-D-ribose 1-methylphosphonate 5-triphosphate diphosphatase n=2 Tax=Roseovarius rhodophyticola TaxID=3080827 RepID=A0ABZ2TIH9_9RHOB|nr:alpha-D-ribose 1-methylphosphonate 5-triphosphate diphosphatase [Roseovarius sp. W115]MDV2929396.1 alpha-D-ribose 1-methylphosphonate 5-triphosphate diphosphatase [Roseovarius sp. W115]